MSADLLSASEAAALLGVTRQAVVKWANQGRLRGFKAGRDWRFERADVEAFKKYNTPQQPESPKAKALLAFA